MERLFAELAELAELSVSASPDELAAALRALPEVGVLPSPWGVWILIDIARYHAERNRALSLSRDRPHPGNLAQPDPGPVPSEVVHESGDVAEYYVNEASGEAWGGFASDTAEDFDVFYATEVAIRRGLDVPQARLRTLCGHDRLIDLAIEDMSASGVLLPGSCNDLFRLAPALLAAFDAIAAVSHSLADASRRCWLAARLGDWPWAFELAADPALKALIAPRANRCLALRRRRLEQALASDNPSTVSGGLHGLAAIDADDLSALLLAALEGPGALTALELLKARWNDRFADPVFALMGRVDPIAEGRGVFSDCATILLTHECHVPGVLARIDAVDTGAASRGFFFGATLLALALAFRAKSALDWVRLGLRSVHPFARLEAAGLLAAIELPWTYRELGAVLTEPDKSWSAPECLAALRRSHDPNARFALDAWERLHPTPPMEVLLFARVEKIFDNGVRGLQAFIAPYRERLADPDPSQSGKG